jgi:hypothetical protein
MSASQTCLVELSKGHSNERALQSHPFSQYDVNRLLPEAFDYSPYNSFLCRISAMASRKGRIIHWAKVAVMRSRGRSRGQKKIKI